MLTEEIEERESAKESNTNKSPQKQKTFEKSDLTQFLQKRILEYERK